MYLAILQPSPSGPFASLCIFHMKFLIALELQHWSYLISVLSFHAATAACLTEKWLQHSSNGLKLQALIQDHVFTTRVSPSQVSTRLLMPLKSLKCLAHVPIWSATYFLHALPFPGQGMLCIHTANTTAGYSDVGGSRAGLLALKRGRNRTVQYVPTEVNHLKKRNQKIKQRLGDFFDAVLLPFQSFFMLSQMLSQHQVSLSN